MFSADSGILADLKRKSSGTERDLFLLFTGETFFSERIVIFFSTENHTRKRDRLILKWPTEPESLSLTKVGNREAFIIGKLGLKPLSTFRYILGKPLIQLKCFRIHYTLDSI